MKWHILMLVLCLALCGCATIPTSGTIDEVPVPGDPAGVQIAPQPPQGDDDPAQIVEGFLLAMTQSDASYKVARAYLTPQASQKWEPHRRTRIFKGSVTQSDGAYGIEGTVLGEIDGTSHYQPVSSRLQHDFKLVQIDGQWRIDNPPEGILLSRYLFERLYQQLTVYFSGHNDEVLVPELLTLPESEVAPSKVVEALIQGPSTRLAGTARNAMPTGAALGREGATVNDSGVVTVDLTGLPVTMPSDQRRRLGAQLLWSLSSVPRVTGLRVTVDRAQFDLPGQSAEGVLELATQQGYSVLSRVTTQELFVVQDGRPGILSDNGRFVALDRELPAAAEVAIALDGSKLAVIGAERKMLHLGPKDGPLASVQTGLTNLRDSQWVRDSLYVLGDSNNRETRLLRVSAKSEVQPIDVNLPQGMTIRAFSVHQAGATAVVVAEDADGMHMGRMVVSAKRGFEQWQELPLIGPSGQAMTGLTDIRWNSESSLVVAGNLDEQPSVVLLSADGAFIQELGSFRDPIHSIAALPRQGGGLIAMRSNDGRVWRYTAPNRWTSDDVSVSALAFPG